MEDVFQIIACLFGECNITVFNIMEAELQLASFNVQKKEHVIFLTEYAPWFAPEFHTERIRAELVGASWSNFDSEWVQVSSLHMTAEASSNNCLGKFEV